MTTVIIFVCGALAGILLTTFCLGVKSATGVLRVDNSNPERTLYRFEIDELDVLDKKTLVIMKVDHSTNLSQK